MPRKSLPVVLSESEILRLEQWIRAGSTPQQVVLRAKIILRASQGQSDQQIAREFKLQRRTAALWRHRVYEQGIGCVWTATVESILEKLERCRRRLEQVQPECTKPKSRKSAKTNE